MKRKLYNVFKQFAKDCYGLFGNNFISLYAFGSSTYNEYIQGYSDLDFLVIINRKLTELDFQKCLELRNAYQDKEYFKNLEGCFISENNIQQTIETNSVYWGTKGAKLKQGFTIKTFTMQNLIDKGHLIYGKDFQDQFSKPKRSEMLLAIEHMIETVDSFASDTKNIKYTLDWVFLLSQSYYYLKTGKVTSKIRAAKWVNKYCFNSKNKVIKHFITSRKNFSKLTEKDKILIKENVKFILELNNLVREELSKE